MFIVLIDCSDIWG